MQKIKNISVTDNQAEVYEALKQFGPLPDVALVPLAQHIGRSKQSSSGLRTRRRELQNRGLIQETGQTVQMPSGRKARVHEVV